MLYGTYVINQFCNQLPLHSKQQLISDSIIKLYYALSKKFQNGFTLHSL
jgi:hypothetical protein